MKLDELLEGRSERLENTFSQCVHVKMKKREEIERRVEL